MLWHPLELLVCQLDMNLVLELIMFHSELIAYHTINELTIFKSRDHKSGRRWSSSYCYGLHCDAVCVERMELSNSEGCSRCGSIGIIFSTVQFNHKYLIVPNDTIL